MAEEYDVVVVGAGHNGLAVAGYLAKAGVNVCVVEKQDVVGGGCLTQELTLPGFKHERASCVHAFIQGNPLIRYDELKLLSKYGLKYVYSSPEEPCATFIYGDGREMCWYRNNIEKTCESIEKFSKRDAESFGKVYRMAKELADMMLSMVFSPIPSLGQIISLLEGNDLGQEMNRSLLLSMMDMADEHCESGELKMAMTRFGSEMCVNPFTKGTGMFFLLAVPLVNDWGLSYPEGGSGVLSQSLERCIKDHGGTIITSSPIKSIKIEGGKAKGVVLENGEEILAKKAVVSNLSVKQLFLQMVDEKWLPENFATKVRRLRHNTYSGLLQVLALNDAPDWKVELGNRAMVVYPFPTNTSEGYYRIHNDIDHGIPNTEMPICVCHTRQDPTRAPAGKHTFYLFHYEPYRLKGGAEKWDEIKQEVADGILQTVQNLTTNMGPENILERWISSPLDYERWNPSWIEGDYYHIGHLLDQNMSNRPLPGWHNYRTPVEGLYMCGSSTSPGGTVSGGGRAAVQIVMEDLGIDFDKVIHS